MLAFLLNISNESSNGTGILAISIVTVLTILSAVGFGRFHEKICGFGFGSWWRHYKLMYTPAIEHSACALVGGKHGDERTSQASVPSRYRRNVHYRPTCHAFDKNAEAIIISDGHLKGLDIPPVSHDRTLSCLSTQHCLICT